MKIDGRLSLKKPAWLSSLVLDAIIFLFENNIIERRISYNILFLILARPRKRIIFDYRLNEKEWLLHGSLVLYLRRSIRLFLTPKLLLIFIFIIWVCLNLWIFLTVRLNWRIHIIYRWLCMKILLWCAN